MTFEEVMVQLEAAGTAQNRKIYARHGAQEPMFGVSYAVQNGLEKKIKVDHALATALWDSENHDARVLACKVADPTLLTSEQADQWAIEASNYGLAGEVAGLVLKSPLARQKGEAWINADSEYVERAGWLIIAALVEKSDLPDDYFLEKLGRIEREIHTAKNRVRDAMNTTVINIGLRPSLTQAALDAASRIGKVVVDHGQTGCVTQDAAGYIQKTLEYRAKKARK